MNQEEALHIIRYYEHSPSFFTQNKSFYWNSEKEMLFKRITKYIKAKQFLKQKYAKTNTSNF